ncbi:hypothetical protein V2J09_000524 [Rumex salicifolius]
MAAPATQGGRRKPVKGKRRPAAMGMPSVLYARAQKSMAVTTSSKLLFTSTMSAASIAMSVPAPIAIPTSAIASAGLASAITISIPASLAIDLAVPGLSPVTIMLFMFMDLRIDITSFALGFNGSDMAITPTISSSMATIIPVWAISSAFASTFSASPGI